ncbi:MAG: hypothetical protein EOO65_03170, partial [Methanosarcinales archaeon]
VASSTVTPPRAADAARAVTSPDSSVVLSAAAAVTAPAVATASSPGGTPAKKSNRCTKCHKKLGLTPFVCRCGSSFCGVHRYEDQVRCTRTQYAPCARVRSERAHPLPLWMRAILLL